MKKIIFLFVVCFALASINLKAQSICSCTSDPNCTDQPPNDGEMCPLPEDWLPATYGVPYEMTLTIIPPESATVLGVPINAIKKMEVTSVKSKLTTESTWQDISAYGFSWCRSIALMPSKQKSCINVSGIPTVVGSVQIKATIKAYMTGDIAIPGGVLDTIIGIIVVAGPPAPTAAFSADKLEVATGKPVVFTYEGTGATSWIWNFDDGTPVVNVQGPVTHVYATTGPKNVSLTVSNVTGEATETKNINVHEALVANFSYSPSEPYKGDEVTFTNLSSPTATTFEWVFDENDNEEGSSNAENPKHTYNTGGYKSVRLIVKNSYNEKDTIVENILIQDSSANAVLANFTFSPDTAIVNQVVTFTNTSINATNYIWTFGDGADDYTENPTHTYTSAGTKKVKLVASNSTSTTSNIITKNIVVKAATSGITSNSVADKILVFPNPASDQLTIKAENIESITILDVNGLVVYYKQTNNTENIIDISRLAYANYIVKIKTKDQMYTKVFLKQ